MSPLGDEPTRSHPRMDWYGDEILCTVSRADYLASDGHPVVAHLMHRFVTTSSRIAALRDRSHEYPPVARNILAWPARSHRRFRRLEPALSVDRRAVARTSIPYRCAPPAVACVRGSAPVSPVGCPPDDPRLRDHPTVARVMDHLRGCCIVRSSRTMEPASPHAVARLPALRRVIRVPPHRLRAAAACCGPAR
jgi:hypothetical protein